MKPSIPRGTRDFGPQEMLKRRHILDTVARYFKLYGFEQIETPAMENITTLTGKYGDEGDQLIYKILNSRIHESKEKDTLVSEFNLSLETSRNSAALTEKALRYDLTVPFARYVVMNHNQLVFPFRRYQMQPVWRADRPQKGRYREFIQCDADVIGSDSLVNEIELLSLSDCLFNDLKIPVTLKINNRKILTALAEVLNEKENLIAITVALDKLDKTSKEAVKDELRSKNISEEAISRLTPLLEFTGDNSAKINVLRDLVGENTIGKNGIDELEYLLANFKPQFSEFELDITLARGLNYYTGTIIEIKTSVGNLRSSIAGGGRYDDLTGIFELQGMSGVGISFGIDRIYDVMDEMMLFPPGLGKVSSTAILFTHFDAETQAHCIPLAMELRKNNIACEVFPDVGKKLGKQFEYANKKGIPFVCVVGSTEMKTNLFAVKNMLTGGQTQMNLKQMIETLSALK